MIDLLHEEFTETSGKFLSDGQPLQLADNQAILVMQKRYKLTREDISQLKGIPYREVKL